MNPIYSSITCFPTKRGDDIYKKIQEKALAIGKIAIEKKATDVLALKVDNLTTIADYFIFCSGHSERQVKAISEAIDGEISRSFSSNPMKEGEAGGTWILLDYGDIVVHIFKEDIREYYGIENMWRDAEPMELPNVQPTSPLGMATFPTHPMKVVHH